jgi:HTH-like domain
VEIRPVLSDLAGLTGPTQVVAELAVGGVAVAVACRVSGVSTSGFSAWRSRPVLPRQVAGQVLTATIRRIHQMPRGTYGSPRVHAELRLAAGVRCGRKRVERLMRGAGVAGRLPAPPARLRIRARSRRRTWCSAVHRGSARPVVGHRHH